MKSRHFLLASACALALPGVAQPSRSDVATTPLPNAEWDASVPAVTLGAVSMRSIAELPPGLKELSERELEQDRVGYADVADDEIDREFAIAQASAQGNPPLHLDMHLSTVPLQQHSLQSYVGMMPPGGPSSQGRSFSATQVFTRTDGVQVALKEVDFKRQGGAIVLVRELMNAKVGPWPARLKILRSKSGAAESVLLWVSREKLHELAVLDDVSSVEQIGRFDRKWLLELATGIKD